METGEILRMAQEVIDEVKDEMGDYRPEIQIAAQFAAMRMFGKLDKKYNFKTVLGSNPEQEVSNG